MVSVPATDATLAPSKVKASPTKRAVGFWAALNARSPLRKFSSADEAMLTLAMSTTTSALPVLAARSRRMLPSLTWNLPRCVDVPRCSVSNVTALCPGSIANVAGSAAAAPAATSIEEISKVLSMAGSFTRDEGTRSWQRSEPRDGQLEADPNVVGDQRDVGPFVLADLEVESLDDELAGRRRERARLHDRNRNQQLLARPLDRQLAGDLQPPGADALDGTRLEYRARELRRVEPRRSGQLGVALGEADGRARGVDRERHAAALRRFRIERDLRVEAAKAAVDRHPALLDLERDLALRRDQPRRRSR